MKLNTKYKKIDKLVKYYFISVNEKYTISILLFFIILKNRFFYDIVKNEIVISHF